VCPEVLEAQEIHSTRYLLMNLYHLEAPMGHWVPADLESLVDLGVQMHHYILLVLLALADLWDQLAR